MHKYTSSQCQYDLTNAYYSSILILHSVTYSYRQELKSELGERPDGPILLCIILKKRQVLVLSKQRKLKDQLQVLRISSEPGENVRNFNVKVRNMVTKIKQTGVPPADLALVAAKRFVNCQVA